MASSQSQSVLIGSALDSHLRMQALAGPSMYVWRLRLAYPVVVAAGKVLGKQLSLVLQYQGDRQVNTDRAVHFMRARAFLLQSVRLGSRQVPQCAFRQC